MKYLKAFAVILISLSLFYSCGGNGSKINTSSKLTAPSDTGDDALMAALKQDTNIVELKIKGDTLSVVTGGWSFWYPFGKFSEPDMLKTIGNGSDLKKEVDNSGPESLQLYTIYDDSSYIKFIKSDETGKLEIVSASITSDNIKQQNGIGVGMSKDAFCKIYFKDVSSKHLQKINVIEFITVLDGLWEYYTFKDETLAKIMFVSDYQVDKE